MKQRFIGATNALSPRFLLFVLLFTSAQLSAQPCVDIADDKERLACFEGTTSCNGLSSGAARLACFDKAISGRQHSLSLEVPLDASADVPMVDQTKPATESPQIEQPVAEQPAKEKVAADDFGKRKGFVTPSEFIASTIVEVKTDRRRIDHLRLENGHVWRETEDHRVRFTVGQTVRIEESMFGSFNLKLDGIKKLIKVKRVR